MIKKYQAFISPSFLFSFLIILCSEAMLNSNFGFFICIHFSEVLWKNDFLVLLQSDFLINLFQNAIYFRGEDWMTCHCLILINIFFIICLIFNLFLLDLKLNCFVDFTKLFFHKSFFTFDSIHMFFHSLNDAIFLLIFLLNDLYFGDEILISFFQGSC